MGNERKERGGGEKSTGQNRVKEIGKRGKAKREKGNERKKGEEREK